mgnify:CR=1 FL=1
MFISKPMRVFITVYEEKNLKRAAKNLYLTVPPVSRMLKITEEWLGVKLFIIERNNIIPTAAADELYHKLSPHYCYLKKIKLLKKQHNLTLSSPLAGSDFFTNIIEQVLTRSGNVPDIKYSASLSKEDDIFMSFSRPYGVDCFIEKKFIIVYTLCCHPSVQKQWKKKDLIVESALADSIEFQQKISNLQSQGFTGKILQIDNAELQKRRFEKGDCLNFRPYFNNLNEEEILPFKFSLPLYVFCKERNDANDGMKFINTFFDIVNESNIVVKHDETVC